MEKKDRNIDDYVNEAKCDVIVYLIFYVIFFVILLLFSLYVNNWLPIVFMLILVFFLFEKVIAYKNIIRIKTYLKKKNMMNDIGEIFFWNEQEYMLTYNYFIIVKKRKVIYFKYDDIGEIYKKLKYNRGGFNEHLYIKLKNNEEYKILIWTTFLVNEEYKDISKYLLEKNRNIKYIDK